jgi:hypothetical protein
VEYALTERGRSLHMILYQLLDWTDDHLAGIQASRAAYDTAHATDSGFPSLSGQVAMASPGFGPVRQLCPWLTVASRGSVVPPLRLLGTNLSRASYQRLLSAVAATRTGRTRALTSTPTDSANCFGSDSTNRLMESLRTGDTRRAGIRTGRPSAYAAPKGGAREVVQL